MTCIVGLVNENEVWIGGDSAAVGGLSIDKYIEPKVFVNNGFIFGYTSSFRMGQILKYRFCPPSIDFTESEEDAMRYMVTEFVPELKKTFSLCGFESQRDGKMYGGQFLVGKQGHLFNIWEDYHVGKSINEYDACGHGVDIALGAMFATKEIDMNPVAKISLALHAAAEHNAGVIAPFYIAYV